MEPCRIIIVEDDHALRFAVSAWLEVEPHFETLAAVSTGHAAIAALNSADPPAQLLLMDLGLPDMDGFELIRVAKAMATPPRIMVLTGHDTEALGPRLDELGVDASMQKGRSPLDLIDRLRDLSR